MDSLKKNVILEGVFASEVPDTSGEVIMVKGMDIDLLPNAPVNTEHITPESVEGSSEIPDNFKGFQSIIGRVVSAKKILSEDDCDTDGERKAWKEIKRPLLYGQIEIFDGNDAPENAKAAAALARMYNNIEDGPRLGLSVEGSTLKRNGNLLEKTVIRAMAATLKPCNRTAFIDLVKDDAMPVVTKSMVTKTAQGTQHEPLRKSVSMQNMVIKTSVSPYEKLSDAIFILKKTLTAGGMNAAPGSLNQGSALQVEHQGSHLNKLMRHLKGKPVTSENVKKVFPELSDGDVEKVIQALKSKIFKKSLIETENAFRKLKNYK